MANIFVAPIRKCAILPFMKEEKQWSMTAPKLYLAGY
jgi:hypothetical protein